MSKHTGNKLSESSSISVEKEAQSSPKPTEVRYDDNTD